MKYKLAKSLGEELCRLRRSKKLTQFELAKRLKTHQPAISRIEKGEFLPSLGYLQKVLIELGGHMEIKILEN